MSATASIVVTGLGAVSPFGAGAPELWRGLTEADCGEPSPVRRFDTDGYRVRTAMLADVPEPTWPASISFALSAAHEALEGARATDELRRRCGLALASTAAGWAQMRDLYGAYRARDVERMGALLADPVRLLKEGPLAVVATRLGLGGPVAVPSSACAAGTTAICWAAEQIAAGRCDVMLAGGTDEVTEVVFAGFHSLRLLSPDRCRPFSADRRGLVLSEGAALLVLEEEQHAIRRGVPILARLAGWGMSCDAFHMTTPHSDGMYRAMQAAMEDAGTTGPALSCVSAHATGSVANDVAEAAAIRRLTAQDSPVRVTGIKGALGHTQGAAGAFAAVAAVQSIRAQRIPPIRGYRGADPEVGTLRLCLEPNVADPVESVLVNSAGFGGVNAACLLTVPGGHTAPPARRRAPGRPVISAVFASADASASWLQALSQGAAADSIDTGEFGALVEESRALLGDLRPLDDPGRRLTAGVRRLLARAELDPQAAARPSEVGACLGTFYGSQRHHEEMFNALCTVGGHRVKPHDFALSTFNTPGSMAAVALGLRGPGIVLLSATAGLGAVAFAADMVSNRRCDAMVAGGYEDATEFGLESLERATGTRGSGAIALALVEDEASVRSRGRKPLARVLASRSAFIEDGHAEAPARLAEIYEFLLEEAGLTLSDLSGVVVAGAPLMRRQQIAAVGRLAGTEAASGPACEHVERLLPECGAATPVLAMMVALRSSFPAAGSRTNADFSSGPFILTASRPLCGTVAMIVEPVL